MILFQPPGPKEPQQDAIIVRNVSKRFHIPHEKKTKFFEHVAGIIKGKSSGYEEFSALKNISFKVKKGEKLGLVGENGSGKSTLLKILSGVLQSDNGGSVKVFGKIAPFLELGVGFQPELTAEENVRLYGAVMGMSKKEIEDRFDGIFEFAELSRFKQMKLKNFSSGMYMRLAFATATATDPDILLIDEVLAVGDEAFQKKCFDKMNEFKMSGKTIVLVSHDLETIKRFCDRAILLEHGKIVSMGNSERVIDDYRSNMRIIEEEVLKKQPEIIVLPESPLKPVEVVHEKVEPPKIEPPKDRWGSGEIEITQVRFYDQNGEEKYIFRTGETLVARITYSAKKRIEKPIFGIAIHRNDGTHITGPNTKFHDNVIESVEGDGIVEYIIDSLPLLNGTYLFTAAVYDFACVNAFDHHERRFKFKVEDEKRKDYGIFYIPCRWKYGTE
ncbi:MAG: ABC transporter ATP-binding protein [Candidatus Methanoperedenaceae archaeon]|nr:MAG: ABC transporter ATP-binding protein [Candidatus Methanoperedenaceae archaeon]